MHTLTININDKVLDKVIYFLKNLPKQDVEIISDRVVSKGSAVPEDFISYLANNPTEVSVETTFLSRNEAHER